MRERWSERKGIGSQGRAQGRASPWVRCQRHPVTALRDLCLRCDAVDYGFAVHGAELGVVALATVCALADPAGFSVAPAGAVGELVVTCEVVPLRAATLTPNACVTY